MFQSEFVLAGGESGDESPLSKTLCTRAVFMFIAGFLFPAANAFGFGERAVDGLHAAGG